MGALGNLAVSMSNKAATAPAPARRAALRWWRPRRCLAALNCIGKTRSAALALGRPKSPRLAGSAQWLPGCSSTSGTRVCRPGPSEEPSRSEPQSGDVLRCKCSPRDAQNADGGLVTHPCHHRPSHCAPSPTFCRRGAPRLARLWHTGSGRRTPRGSRWITTGQMRRRKIKSRNRILNSEEALAAVALSRPPACGGQGDSRRSEASLTFFYVDDSQEQPGGAGGGRSAALPPRHADALTT